MEIAQRSDVAKMKNSFGKFLLLFALAAIVALAWLKPLDATAERQVDEGLKRALTSFAVARVLNGLISVAQGTEIALTPAGIGANLTPGQILDPVNDLVEQFSELMLIASVAFGIMKVMLSIGSYWVFSAILSVVALAWAALKLTGRLPPILLTKFLLVLIFVRFSVPLAAVGSDQTYKQFLEKSFNESQMAIENSKSQLTTMDQPAVTPSASVAAPPQPVALQPDQSNGWWGLFKAPITSTAQYIGDKVEQIQQKFDPRPHIEKLKALTNQLVEHVINLIVVFVLQTIIIPLVFMWALYRSCLALSDSASRTHVVNVPDPLVVEGAN
ncbi:MAG: hypothetical protein Q7J38_13500 [Gallionella sp.]|nr:hypothetical protein [Gallionella sp.]